MPDEGDILLLGKLGRAVGANSDYTSFTRLAEDGLGGGSLTKMSDFDAGDVGPLSLSPTSIDTSPISGVATLNFPAAGPLFAPRIANRVPNFNWSKPADAFNNMSLNTTSDRTAPYTVALAQPNPSTITVGCTFREAGQADGFNDHVTGYNLQKTADFNYTPSCFTADTLILMSDGSYKKIVDIEVEDIVVGLNGNNTVLKLDPTKLGHRLLYGFNDMKPFFTSEHPFFTEQGWKSIDPQATIDEKVEDFETLDDIGKLEIGDVILGKEKIEIKDIHFWKDDDDLDLYNFNVDNDNTYTANDFVVHNKCFVGDTLITMSDGTYEQIQDIKVGDVVFTQLGNEVVKEVYSPIHDNILEYTFSDGTKTKNTSDHPYYVIDKGWCSSVPNLTKERYNVDADKFICGDICINDDNEQVELISLKEVKGEIKTYTFSVDSQTYYANKILVHSEI